MKTLREKIEQTRRDCLNNRQYILINVMQQIEDHLFTGAPPTGGYDGLEALLNDVA